MDSSTESPLDVLSRAATMVQDNALLPPSYDEARSYLKCKELAAAMGGRDGSTANGGKWKRERRSRPATIAPHQNPTLYTSSRKSPITVSHPEPIDMSTRKIRGSPPSYSQSISSAGYLGKTGHNRASVITTTTCCNTNNNNNNNRSGISDGGSMCDDPVIDEHFRRSLGKDYQSVFASSSSPSLLNNRLRIASNGQTDDSSDEGCDVTGSALSVDEHFAKALGETWVKLQQKEKKNGTKHLTADSSSVGNSKSWQNQNAPPSVGSGGGGGGRRTSSTKPTALSSSSSSSTTSSLASTSSTAITSSLVLTTTTSVSPTAVTSTTEHKSSELLRLNRYED